MIGSYPSAATLRNATMNATQSELTALGADMACHLCGAPASWSSPPSVGFAASRPIADLGRREDDCAAAQAAARVQKTVDEAWNREVAELYAGYAIYDQAAGAEQAVFDQATGAATSRSTRLLAALAEQVELARQRPHVGRRLRQRGHAPRVQPGMPGWSLAGTELGDKYRGTIESITGVERLYTCQPWEVPGEFDVVAMIHVLEHIPHPEAYLKQLVTKLRPGGMLIVELPHHVANPFELLIADHCTHFAADTAAAPAMCRL